MTSRKKDIGSLASTKMINANKWTKTRNPLRELLNLLSCSKCKKGLQNPQQFLNCGHVACFSCINCSNNMCFDCVLDKTIKDPTKNETIQKIVKACHTIASVINFESNNEDAGSKSEQVSLSDNLPSDDLSSDSDVTIFNPKFNNKKWTTRDKLTKKTSKKFRKRKKDAHASSDQAVKKPKLDKFRAILCNPKKINKRSPKGETILFRECIKNRKENVRAFLDAGADPNIPCFAGWTALQESVAYNHYEIAEALLKSNADVNKKGHEGRTALHEAAINDNFRIIQLLLNYGANKKILDNDGRAPLFYCKSEEAKTLLRSDLKMEVQNDCTENESIFTEDSGEGLGYSTRAVQNSLLSLLPLSENEMYLEPNTKKEDNASQELAIMYEKVNNMNISVEPLIEDVSNYDVPKHPGKENSNAEAYENCTSSRLLNKKTITNKSHSDTSRHNYDESSTATSSENRSMVLNVFNHKGEIGFLQNTGKNGLSDKYSAILNKPNKINERFDKGETLLLQECGKNNIDNVKALLEAGADPNIPCFAGWTPLQKSVDYNYHEIAEALLKSNADVNKKGHEGRTALHEAARNNNISIIQLLLSYGGKKYEFDESGKAPVSYCRSEEAKALLHIDTELKVRSDSTKEGNATGSNSHLIEVSIEDPSTSEIIILSIEENSKGPSILERITRNSLSSVNNDEEDKDNDSSRNESIFAEENGKDSSNFKRTTLNSLPPMKKKEGKIFLEPNFKKDEKASLELDIVFEKINTIDPKFEPSKKDATYALSSSCKENVYSKANVKNVFPSYLNQNSKITNKSSDSVLSCENYQKSIVAIGSKTPTSIHERYKLSNSPRNTDREENIDIEN